MNTEYKKFDDKIAGLKREIDNLCSKNLYNDFEDNKLYNILEKVSDVLDNYTDMVKYFEIEATEGTLLLNSNERFVLGDHEFSSGSSIEVWNKNEELWNMGRVEYADKYPHGYYFKNYDYDNFALENGMKARYRK